MSFLSEAGAVALNEGITNVAAWGSLHSSFSDVGENELSGGTPSYARQEITWGESGDGRTYINSNELAFDIPSGSSVLWFGLWTDEVSTASATFFGMVPFAADNVGYAVARGGASATFYGGEPTASTHVHRPLSIRNRALPRVATNELMTEGGIYYLGTKDGSGDGYEFSLLDGSEAGPQVEIESDDRPYVAANAQPKSYFGQSTLSLISGKLVLTIRNAE